MTRLEPQYKVPRVADEFGLPDLKDRLVEYWTRDEDPLSLRELASFFNRNILQAAMVDAGMDPLDGEVANTYRLLTDDEVSSGVRTEIRKKLEHNGIDVDHLESSFVTYQAIRTYLKEGRDLDYEQDDSGVQRESVEETLNRLQTRMTTVTNEKLEQLRQADEISLGEFRVLLDLRIFCDDCGRQYKLGDLLEQSGCDCKSVATEST